MPAAAAVSYVVDGVAFAVPACCRPSAQNSRHKYIGGTTVISIFVLHTTVHITKIYWPHFSFRYELTPKQEYNPRTATYICAAAAVVFVLHTLANLFPNICRCCLQPAFFSTPRKFSTTAAAVVVPTR